MVGLRDPLRRRTAEWITHTFREHNTEADLWTDKGAPVRAKASRKKVGVVSTIFSEFSDALLKQLLTAESFG